MKNPPTIESMRLRLAGLCSRSEQCESDLRAKILRARLPAEAADDIITFLKEGRFLDNSRFARSYALDKVRFSGWGVNKIRAALAMKRIPQSDIGAALEAIPKAEYMEAVKKVAAAKVRSLDLRLQADRAAFCRHMLSRGFETPVVMKTLDYLVKKTDSDSE
ncbi:MAG: RecX family transcriptional regulator [Muribaculaceae bacterium]|nr:RecX family transcriptional regulator [Muribaculaceae bacterium]